MLETNHLLNFNTAKEKNTNESNKIKTQYIE